jgi:hypothetical protein
MELPEERARVIGNNGEKVAEADAIDGVHRLMADAELFETSFQLTSHTDPGGTPVTRARRSA